MNDYTLDIRRNICPICKEKIRKSILLSYPPKYKYECGCGKKKVVTKELSE